MEANEGEPLEPEKRAIVTSIQLTTGAILSSTVTVASQVPVFSKRLEAERVTVFPPILVQSKVV